YLPHTMFFAPPTCSMLAPSTLTPACAPATTFHVPPTVITEHPVTARFWCSMGASAFAAPTTRVRTAHEVDWSPPIVNMRAPPMITASDAAPIDLLALTLTSRRPAIVYDCAPATPTWWTVPTMSLRDAPIAWVSVPTTEVTLSFSVRSL